MTDPDPETDPVEAALNARRARRADTIPDDPTHDTAVDAAIRRRREENR